MTKEAEIRASGHKPRKVVLPKLELSEAGRGREGSVLELLEGAWLHQHLDSGSVTLVSDV